MGYWVGGWCLYRELKFLVCAGCYPFYQKDPFILSECPHVYFSGNAPKYQSKRVTGQYRTITLTVIGTEATPP